MTKRLIKNIRPSRQKNGGQAHIPYHPVRNVKGVKRKYHSADFGLCIKKNILLGRVKRIISPKQETSLRISFWGFSGFPRFCGGKGLVVFNSIVTITTVSSG